MSIEQEAKEFIDRKAEKLEPVALHCNGCGVWSGYNIDNNHKLPRGWRSTEKGYVCNDCRTKQRIK